MTFDTLINAIRQIIGEPDFFHVISGYSDKPTWDYGAMIEYFVAALILLVCVSSVFRFLRLLIK